jgi:hypothetical protein
MVEMNDRTHEKEILDAPVFIIDELTGTLRTNQTYGQFADGYFVVVIKATNAPTQRDFTKVKVSSGDDRMIFKFNWAKYIHVYVCMYM